MMKQLHRGVIWGFRFDYFIYFMIFSLSLFIVGLLGPFPLFLISIRGSASGVLGFFLQSFSFLIIFSAAIAEICARFAYKNWKYEFLDEELRIECGVVFKRYISVPYSRIQNVEIQRGIFARKFDYSGLVVHTAGFSGTGLAEGNIPAVSVEEAEKLRNFLMNKVKNKSGL